MARSVPGTDRPGLSYGPLSVCTAVAKHIDRFESQGRLRHPRKDRTLLYSTLLTKRCLGVVGVGVKRDSRAPESVNYHFDAADRKYQRSPTEERKQGFPSESIGGCPAVVATSNRFAWHFHCTRGLGTHVPATSERSAPRNVPTRAPFEFPTATPYLKDPSKPDPTT